VRWFISAYLALAAFLLVKKFAFDIVRVNNKDMHATFMYGDAVLVKKCFNNYQRGDLLYSVFPIQDTALSRTFFIQRVMGLPGDTLQIKDKEVFVNGNIIPDTNTVRFNYYVKSKKVKLDSVFREKYSLQDGGQVSAHFDYSFALSKLECNKLKEDSAIMAVTRKAEKKNSYDDGCFPNSEHFTWNMDHYGKIYIPKMNDTLTLDSVNIHLYKRLITDLEKNELRIENDSIQINGKYTNQYVVKKNYYFLLGDNRDNANDSRNWGYLPDNFVVGKVIRTVRSMK
jgi:signal peptidase I